MAVIYKILLFITQINQKILPFNQTRWCALVLKLNQTASKAKTGMLEMLKTKPNCQ